MADEKMQQGHAPSEKLPVYSRRWFHLAAQAALIILIVYAMVFVDVWLRGKEAFKKAEGHEAAAKQLMAAEASEKDQKKRDAVLAEISENWKMTHVWYQTVYEQFPLRGPGSWWKKLNLPESPWVTEAAKRDPAAKEQWKQSLMKRKIPFEDYMLD